MREFVLDTSGSILCGTTSAGEPKPIGWGYLDPFTQGYVEALFAEIAIGPIIRLGPEDSAIFAGALLDPAKPNDALMKASARYREAVVAQKESGIFPTPILVTAPAFSDLAPETLAAILKDCEKFQACEMAELCNAAEGAWLWSTRQSGLSEELSEDFSPLIPYLGDDGKVYLRAAT